MKKYLMAGVSALALCSTLMSCSHDDITTYSGKINFVETYEQAFITRFGQPAPDQDWGFGSGSTTATRAVFTETWPGVHTDCKFDESVFEMNVPSNAVDLTKGNFTEVEKNAKAFYIPSKFTGDLNFNYAFNIPAGAKIYNQGKVTAINGVNYNGVVTFYNVNELGFGEYNGGRHTVINTGVLTVFSYGNIGTVYNKGTLVLERGHNPYWPNEGGTADISNETYIYSNGEGSVLMPDGGDLKAVCDIHGTLTVGNREQNIVKNVKIQNSTKKYICGIDCTGKVENVDGPLETSYVKADLFTFDGNPIYLLPGGHVDVTTLQVPNDNSKFYGAANSTGLVEAVNYEFGNKNDFTHTFSNNIYFKVNGGYVKVDNCYAMGQSHNFATVDEYLAYNGHSDSQNDEFGLAKDRVNAGNAAGSPACGEPWGIGTGTPEPKPTPNIVRIIAEDLTVMENTDFDFNDVVFDVEWIDDNTAKITLQAAGGTLPLTVGGDDYEVHKMFGLSNTNQMINTRTSISIQLDPVSYTITGAFGRDANKIPVKVCKRGEWIELFAERGKPASKIAINSDEQGYDPRNFRWCDERIDIEDDYKEFPAWVRKEVGSERWYAKPTVKWN